jgi:formylmethanofuran dehydrogenase subunit E
MVIAGFMVDLACRNLPEGSLFEVICETASCIPDAVQILHPCTIGNQWMKIIDTGRYAMIFYDKYTGEGVRVSLDIEKLQNYPAVNEWHLKLKPKHEQDKEALMKAILEAGTDILALRKIKVSSEFLGKSSKTVGICPVCGEPSARTKAISARHAGMESSRLPSPTEHQQVNPTKYALYGYRAVLYALAECYVTRQA